MADALRIPRHKQGFINQSRFPIVQHSAFVQKCLPPERIRWLCAGQGISVMTRLAALRALGILLLSP
jgi:hypothetical protein